MKTLLIAASLMFFAIFQTYADNDHPIVLTSEKLAACRDSIEARALKDCIIQKAFAKRVQCVNGTDIFENASRAKAFLVVEKQSNGFGGSFIFVVFEKVPKLYRFWLYPIDKENELEIREAVELRKLPTEIMNEIARREYSDDWIHL